MNYQEMHQVKSRKAVGFLKEAGAENITLSGSFIEFTYQGVFFRLTDEQIRVVFAPIYVDVFIQAQKGRKINVNTNFAQPV